MMPCSVQVGPLRYSVSLTRNLHDTQNQHGVTNTTFATIEVADPIHPDQQRLTFFHELCHACWHVAYEPDDSSRDKFTQEEALRILTPTLLSVLRTNPEVAKYLLEEA